jgi:hypothetical protein
MVANLRAGAQAVVAGLAAALFGLAVRAWLLALLAHPGLQAAMQAMLDAPQQDGRCLAWQRCATCRVRPSCDASRRSAAPRQANFCSSCAWRALRSS